MTRRDKQRSLPIWGARESGRSGSPGRLRGWEACLARQVGLGCSLRCSHAPEQPLGDLREDGGFCKEMAP